MKPLLSKPTYCYAFIHMKPNRQTLETESKQFSGCQGLGKGVGNRRLRIALRFLSRVMKLSEMSGNGLSVTL